jgi:hypothetical protein
VLVMTLLLIPYFVFLTSLDSFSLLFFTYTQHCLGAILASSYDYDVYNDQDLDTMVAQDAAVDYGDDADVNANVNDSESTTSLTKSTSKSTISEPSSSSSLSLLSQKQKVSKKQQEMEKSDDAHRNRRYITACHILVSSEECLFPDNNNKNNNNNSNNDATTRTNDNEQDQAQAPLLLPMLNQLLLPFHQRPTSTSPLASDPFEIIRGDVLLFLNNGDDDDDEHEHEDDVLKENLQAMTPGSGFKCLSLLLFQHLITAKNGYDARARHAFKTLGVAVLVHDADSKRLTTEDIQDYSPLVAQMTRKFESLEHVIAERLLSLAEQAKSSSSKGDKSKGDAGGAGAGAEEGGKKGARRFSRKNLVRGLKVGTAGIVAGSLLIVTGGMAAPGIAAGLTALGMGAIAGTFLALASTTAVLSIFGAAGGSLAAYKMNRRTVGLTEFAIQQEGLTSTSTSTDGADGSPTTGPKAQLFRTVFLSGWLGDVFDFQRPWGVQPTNPALEDKLELLERFYAVHYPELVPYSKDILKRWEGEEALLWELLKNKYGTDPSHLFPLKTGPRFDAALSDTEEVMLDKLIIQVGELCGNKEKKSKADKKAKPAKANAGNDQPKASKSTALGNAKSPETAPPNGTSSENSSDPPSNASDFEIVVLSEKKEGESELPKHLSTVWDYGANYGGEYYTVKWESQLIMDISDSVRDLAKNFVSKGAKKALEQTVAATLILAAALPSAIYGAMSCIDGEWALAIERSEAAGKELARSLLFNRAGNRPVTLVGFSFGARVIYFCLKEMVLYQEKWEALEAAGGRKNKKSADDEEDEEEFTCEPASVIEDVILMGAPLHLELTTWKKCRQIVAGRFVNVYSRKDLMLSLMFKFKRVIKGGLRPVCGTCTVAVPGVENVDVSDIISSHTDYCRLPGEILKRVRHAQPVKSLSNGRVDEVSLIAEAQKLALEEEKEIEPQDDSKK